MVRHAILAVLFATAAFAQGYDDLLDDLKSDDAYVRNLASKALVERGGEAIPHLVKAIEASDPALREQALKTLELFLDHEDEAVRAKAQEVIARARPVSALDQSILLRLLEDRERLGTAEEAAPQLLKIIETRAGPLKLAAGKAFALYGADARAATAKLIALGKTKSWPQRFAVVEALAGIGPTVAAPLLAAFAEDGTGAVAAFAPEVFFRLGTGVVAAALPALQSEDKKTRAAACAMLGFARPTQFAVPPLSAALHDPSGAVRRAAARALGGLSGEAVPALVHLAADETRRAQREAVEALARVLIDAAKTDRTAARLLTDRDRKIVDRGLTWLARNQEPSGAWDAARHGGGAEYAPGVTSLALIALLSGGVDDGHKRTATAGLRWLVAVQDEEGVFGPRKSQHFLYNHALATLAMSMACGQTHNPTYGAAAQRGLDFIAKARSPNFGWRYIPGQDDSDTSMTAWMAHAVRTGLLAGLRIDPECLAGTLRYLDKVTEQKGGRIGYTFGTALSARPTDLLQTFPAEQTRAMTAAGALAWFCAGSQPSLATIQEALKYPPVWDTTTGRLDMYYWYQATLLAHHFGGGMLQKWGSALKRALADGQAEDGSWPPAGPWGKDGGRVYATALMAASLKALDGRAQPVRFKTPKAPMLRQALAVLLSAQRHGDEAISRAAKSALLAFE